MKKFISDFFKFNIFFIGSILLLVVGRVFYERYVVSFEIPQSKIVLLVGDSRAECAVNDTIVADVFNYSQSGTAYFYSYLKIREILDHNPQIKTVMLGYSYENVAEFRDDWFDGFQNLKNFMPKYFFLFDFSDFISLVSANPYGTLINIPRIIFTAIKGSDQLGGYVSLKRDKLQEAKDRLVVSNEQKEVKYSKYQEEYLLKIYKLVRSRNVDLILLAVPIHPLMEQNLAKYKDYYYSFAEQKLPKAKLINHLMMDIPEYGFADLGHLNYKGSKLYSEYLQKFGF